MENIEEFVDERNKAWCIYCGAWLTDVTTNEDHVPSKSLLYCSFNDSIGAYII
jgi:hypothetical protein